MLVRFGTLRWVLNETLTDSNGRFGAYGEAQVADLASRTLP
jgi:hypothetical protein